NRWAVVDRALPMARCHALSPLPRLRLLAYQPEFLPDPRRDAVADLDRNLRLVPLGTGSVGIQPADPVRASILIGLLGPHRIRLWTIFHPDQACTNHRRSDARPGDHLLFHVGVGLHPHPRQTMAEKSRKKPATRLVLLPAAVENVGCATSRRYCETWESQPSEPKRPVNLPLLAWPYPVTCFTNSTTSLSAHRPSYPFPSGSPTNAQWPPSAVSTYLRLGFLAIFRRVSGRTRMNGSFPA